MIQQREYLRRVFHCVGQGAFFTETFFCDNGKKELKKINIVYDCGTGKRFYKTTQPITTYSLYDYITTVFDVNEPIKAVFISHLDSDHCNHLPVLLQHCRIEHLFLPLLSDENEKLYYFFKETNKYKNKIDSTFTQELIIDCFNTIKKFCKEDKDKMPKIHLIPQLMVNDFEKELIDLQIDSLSDNDFTLGYSNLRLLLHSQKSNSIFQNWCFIPYNFKFTERYKTFVNYLKKDARTCQYIVNGKADLNRIMIDIQTKADILKSFNKIYNDCKKLIGNINENSMTLYSGDVTGALWQTCMLGEEFCMKKANCRLRCQSNCQKPLVSLISSVKKEFGRPGCLYLGDFDSNCLKVAFWDSIFFKKIKKYTSIYQQPHHGANKNFNDSLLANDSPQYTFFNYGVTNGRYAHPHTCSKIKSKNITTYHVTKHQIFKSIVWQPIKSNKDYSCANHCKCSRCKYL